MLVLIKSSGTAYVTAFDQWTGEIYCTNLELSLFTALRFLQCGVVRESDCGAETPRKLVSAYTCSVGTVWDFRTSAVTFLLGKLVSEINILRWGELEGLHRCVPVPVGCPIDPRWFVVGFFIFFNNCNHIDGDSD